MSEQELQAKLGVLVQQYGMTRETIASLQRTLGGLAESYAELGRSLPSQQGKGDVAKAQKALATLPDTWDTAKVRELLMQYQEASACLVGLQEQLRPYGLG